MTRLETFEKLFRGMDRRLHEDQLRVYIDITFSLTVSELSAGVDRLLVDPDVERLPTAGQLLRYCRPRRRDTSAPVHKSEPDPAIADLAVFGGEMTALLCWSCQKEFEHFQGYADRLAKLRALGERAPLLCGQCAKIHLDSIRTQPHRKCRT